jgi:hypothetical protein
LTETCRVPASPPFVHCFRPSPKRELSSRPRHSLRVCCCCRDLQSTDQRETEPNSAQCEVSASAEGRSMLAQATAGRCPEQWSNPRKETHTAAFDSVPRSH